MHPIKKAYKYAKAQNLIHEGQNWYIEAHNFAFILSQTYQINLDKVCAVISALSPAVSWDQNKKDAKALCQLFDLNLHNENVYQYHNFSTYGQNVQKAVNILNSDKSPIEFFPAQKSGFKTHSFYLNILNPFEYSNVTIDRHALAVCDGFNTSRPQSLTRLKYVNYEKQYQGIAKELGLIPCELQAIVWVAYKHAQDNNVKIFKTK